MTGALPQVMIAGAYPVLNYIPVASLSGIMFVVVIHTFKWSDGGGATVAGVVHLCREPYACCR